jgi:hypothetical protein
MKYILTGLHCSGKQEVIDILENNGIKCGKLFTNIENVTNIYNGLNYEQYTSKDINDIFENNAYIFMQEYPDNKISTVYEKYYEGLSLYEFENNDVFILSPDQLFSINPTTIKDDITFVWLDNIKDDRLNRYYSEKRPYSFYDRENIERKDINSFVKLIYGFNNSNVMYFTNEEPVRIAAIIYSMIKHPDLTQMFIENFN